jgi:hypothetical protein
LLVQAGAMNRSFLLLSLVSFCFAYEGMAHGQTIIIRQSDFAGARPYAGVVKTDGTPMRIIPAMIGRPEPLPVDNSPAPGLLIPQTAAISDTAPSPAADSAARALTISVSSH